MNNKSYSRLQYFLWLISGSEISVLKNCPTDYNRHAGIGFTVLMTSLFGAFAGGYAGYYFSQSTFGAICFGLLWGLLIFSIDRTMVVSMKKRTDSSWEKSFWQIFFRAILAALIAFIISIPLELLVFRDNIDAGKAFYKQSQLLNLGKGYDSLYRPEQDHLNFNIASQQKQTADSIGNLDPQDSDFRALINDINANLKELASASSTLRQEKAAAIRFYDASLEQDNNSSFLVNKNSDSYRNYLISKRIQRTLSSQITRLNEEIANLRGKINLRRNEWRAKYEAESVKAKTKAEAIEAEIQIEKNKTDSARKSLDSTLVQTENSFVVRFDVLSFLAKKKNDKGEREFPSIFFLLWLIRILFFVIEILPTIVKVVTPYGAYDAAVYEAEENFKNIKLVAAKELLQEKVKKEHQIEKVERERQLKYRMSKEGALHDKLVDEISETQNIIAKQILENWKKKHANNTTDTNSLQ